MWRVGVTVALFKVEDLSFSYLLGKTTCLALNHLNLEIPEGKLTALAGPSGSGKSTLLSVLGLIESVPEKKVFFNETDLGALSENEKNSIRRDTFGFIFQSFHLFEALSAKENVAYFLKNYSLTNKEKSERVEHSLSAVGLWKFRDKKPLELSGGQRQRVAIARALAKTPKVILADEPTASLDQKTGREVMELLSKIVEEEKKSVVLASHDLMALSFADSILHMRDGVFEKVERKGQK